jgi:xanthine/CO dehydrogenase XdhC/CoxF family maturation factor
MKAFFHQLADALATGQAVVVATIIGAQGSVPRQVGTKMVVGDAGVLWGSGGMLIPSFLLRGFQTLGGAGLLVSQCGKRRHRNARGGRTGQDCR